MRFLQPLLMFQLILFFHFSQAQVKVRPKAQGPSSTMMATSPLTYDTKLTPSPLKATSSTVQTSPYPTKTTEQRLIEVERKLREFEQWYSDFYLQSKERVSPFLGEKISFGGFFESAISHIEGHDMTAQTSSNSNILGINIAAEFNEKIRFVTQYITALGYNFQNPNNNPGLTPPERGYSGVVFGTIVAHAYLEYRQSEQAVMQMGLGYVPFGIAFQNREPVLFRRRSGPQMVSASDATSVGTAFPLWMGLHLMGSFPMEKGRLGYNLYSFSPSMFPSSVGAGTRFWWSNSQNITVGISGQTGDQGVNGYFYNYGADVNFEHEMGGVVAEYLRNVTSGVPVVESYYVEPYFNFADGEWVVYAAADYINNPNHKVGAVADPYEIWKYGGGVNWLPIANTRFRLGYMINDYLNSTNTIAGQERDYSMIDFSVGVAF